RALHRGPRSGSYTVWRLVMSLSRCCIGFVLLVLLAGPISAAETDKYLLDDTDAVLALNLRNLVDSPLFKKVYQPLVQKLLKEKPEVQKHLLDLGFDPLKDVDRILVVHGESCHRQEGKESGVVVILRGRFDPTKIQSKLAVLAQFVPKLLQIHKNANGI